MPRSSTMTGTSAFTSLFKGSGSHLSTCGVNKLLNNLSLLAYTENRKDNRPQRNSYAYVAGKAIRVDGSKLIHQSRREPHNRTTSRNSDAGHACIYHPPKADNGSMREYMITSLDSILRCYPECGIILTGDFNQLREGFILTRALWICATGQHGHA